MEIQNSKFDSNTYLNFAINSRALPNVILSQAKYYFKGWEVKKIQSSNSLQIKAKTKMIWAFEENWLERNGEFKFNKLSWKWFLAIQNSRECKDTFGKGWVRIPLPILNKRNSF